jgi:hypothetical protein
MAWVWRVSRATATIMAPSHAGVCTGYGWYTFSSDCNRGRGKIQCRLGDVAQYNVVWIPVHQHQLDYFTYQGLRACRMPWCLSCVYCMTIRSNPGYCVGCVSRLDITTRCTVVAHNITEKCVIPCVSTGLIITGCLSLCSSCVHYIIIQSKLGPAVPSVSREHLTSRLTVVINNTAEMSVIPQFDGLYLEHFLRRHIKQSSWADLFHPLGKLYKYVYIFIYI